MSKNKILEIRKDEKEPPKKEAEESPTKKESRALLAVYKKQNPVKYAAKKERGEFERYLNKLK